MDEGKRKYWVDLTMLLAFLVTMITGLVIFFLLPGGTKLGPDRMVFGITRGVWRDVHNWAGIIMLVLVLAHLVMHWRWMVYMTKGYFKAGEKETAKKKEGSGKKYN